MRVRADIDRSSLMLKFIVCRMKLEGVDYRGEPMDWGLTPAQHRANKLRLEKLIERVVDECLLPIWDIAPDSSFAELAQEMFDDMFAREVEIMSHCGENSGDNQSVEL